MIEKELLEEIERLHQVIDVLSFTSKSESKHATYLLKAIEMFCDESNRDKIIKKYYELLSEDK